MNMGFTELFIAAGAAALATSLGATVVLLFRKIGCGVHSALVAFSAGLMMYSAMEMLTQSHKAGDFTLAVGFLAGVLVLYVAERMLPHLHFWVRNSGGHKFMNFPGSLAALLTTNPERRRLRCPQSSAGSPGISNVHLLLSPAIRRSWHPRRRKPR